MSTEEQLREAHKLLAEITYKLGVAGAIAGFSSDADVKVIEQQLRARNSRIESVAAELEMRAHKQYLEENSKWLREAAVKLRAAS